MLLTSGQISVAITSSIVFIFTSLLFLSGYVLQQQSIRSLQEHIHPKPAPPPVPTTNPVLAKHFGRPPGHSFYDKYLASNRLKGGWAKVAYVQLLREHVHVCGAVMMFAALERGESMAQRILMYPREWDREPKGGKKQGGGDHEVETTRRLLREAASQYKVMLQPIDAAIQPKESEAQKSRLSAREKYSLTNLLSLINYNRIIYFEPSGLFFDTSPLDLLFTLSMETPMLGLSTLSKPRVPTILLVEPSKKLYQDTVSSLPEGAYSDSEFLAQVKITPAPSKGERSSILLAETSDLNQVADEFNATEFLDSTAYVLLRDPGILGPEYDISRTEMTKATPKEAQARKAWEEVYERFRQVRMGVCGLDLQPIARKIADPRDGDVEDGHDGEYSS